MLVASTLEVANVQSFQGRRVLVIIGRTSRPPIGAPGLLLPGSSANSSCSCSSWSSAAVGPQPMAMLTTPSTTCTGSTTGFFKEHYDLNAWVWDPGLDLFKLFVDYGGFFLIYPFVIGVATCCLLLCSEREVGTASKIDKSPQRQAPRRVCRTGLRWRQMRRRISPWGPPRPKKRRPLLAHLRGLLHDFFAFEAVKVKGRRFRWSKPWRRRLRVRGWRALWFLLRQRALCKRGHLLWVRGLSLSLLRGPCVFPSIAWSEAAMISWMVCSASARHSGLRTSKALGTLIIRSKLLRT